MPELERGAKNGKLKSVQDFLVRFGYLRSAAYSPGVLDDLTSDALALYQRRNGLRNTAAFDAATKNAMTRPRCGMPDLVRPAFAAASCTWNRTYLTFAFGRGTTDTRGGREFGAVRSAFATWTTVSPFIFTEVGHDEIPEIMIEWRQANDPDHDMRGDLLGGNVVAHADLPPGCSVVTRDLPKPVHFDDSEHTWAIGAAADSFDIETIALHELGHILGLLHTDVEGAVMFPTVAPNSTLRELQPDDLEGIESLYPAVRTDWMTPVLQVMMS